jgi:class 3 adenylate cyclase
MEPQIQYALTSDAVSIACYAHGDGRTFVEMPPAPWSHVLAEWRDPYYRTWNEALSARSRFVRYDGRGTGLSDRRAEDTSIDAMCRDLDAVVDKLRLDTFALCGVVSTAPPAIAYAVRNPDRVSHLILWCGGACKEDLHSPAYEAVAPLLQTDWHMYTETVAHAMVAGWAASPMARGFAALMREAATPAIVQAYEPLWQDSDVREELPRLQVPTLIMHRRDVPWPPVDVARNLAARIPNSRLALLEGDSVLPYVGEMQSVLAAVDDFLGDHHFEHRSAGSVFRTVLFSDVEGSTSLTSRLGDEQARDLLRDHDRLLRQVLKAHGGQEVKALGDGFMASFASASSGLECAIALQRAFAAQESGVRIRVGLSAGEPISEEQDLFGTTVITAARIAGLARGGEVLAADVVRQLVAGKRFLFADRGETVLRGFEDPVRVFELRWQD